MIHHAIQQEIELHIWPKHIEALCPKNQKKKKMEKDF